MDEAVKLSIEQMEQVAGGILEDSVDPNAIYGTDPDSFFIPTTPKTPTAVNPASYADPNVSF